MIDGKPKSIVKTGRIKINAMKKQCGTVAA